MSSRSSAGGSPSRRLGLRARATLGFGLTGLLVAVVLAVVTYGVARSYLIDQRQSTAERQAYVNARLVRAVLRTPDPDIRGLMGTLGGGAASSSVLQFEGNSYATSVTLGSDVIPDDLERTVVEGHAGHQRFRAADGELLLAVGVPIAAVDGAYYEVFTLDELERSLDLLGRSLTIGVVVAAIAAAVIGRTAAARVVQPLGPIADAAEQISDGALETRLDDNDDPDLRRLTDAFNSMAAALEARIERETRFAADVSHELRSPLTAVAAAVEIIDRRRDQLPPEIVEAFAVLTEKVATFQQMVLELLEISRVDAGTAAMSLEEIDLREFLDRALARHGAPGARVSVDAAVPARVTVDRRRMAQVVGNILENAAHYAGGTTAVTAWAPDADHVRLAFDDRGPGVPTEERDAVFGRFARGDAGRRAGTGSGTGLGLSLVVEHLRLHGGRVWIEDSPDGGARFVVELPVGADR